MFGGLETLICQSFRKWVDSAALSTEVSVPREDVRIEPMIVAMYI